MSNNAPAFDAIRAETGIQTADGIQSLWTTMTQGLLDAQTSTQTAKDRFEPKVLNIAPVANVDNLPLKGASMVYFTGSTTFNLTGMLAPDPGKSRIVVLYNQQATIITLKFGATSDAANQLITARAADLALAPGASVTFMYLGSRWRQIGEATAGVLITPASAVTYTGITIGNGAISTAKYTEIGKFTIIEGGLVWGTTTVATGAYGLATLPTSNLATAAAYQVGTCMAFDSSAGQWFSGVLLTGGATTAQFMDIARPMATFVAANPFVWATSDQLYWRLIYQEP